MRGAIPGALMPAASWPAEAQGYRQVSQWCNGQSAAAKTRKPALSDAVACSGVK